MIPSTFSADPPSLASSSTFSLPSSAIGDGNFNYGIAWYGNIHYLLCAEKKGHGYREWLRSEARDLSHQHRNQMSSMQLLRAGLFTFGIELLRCLI
ncbi:hypothetical protein CQW23_23343 [Capsicum baccatum]|uniref:Uncharacterized protein n=1 Tax=Capsicum baccatum TaxID=33114 RepID=A0A2G2VRR2_CAPBA|nr:hypothetical protein CQW23_23343 [Capsicum baccatum]